MADVNYFSPLGELDLSENGSKHKRVDTGVWEVPVVDVEYYANYKIVGSVDVFVVFFDPFTATASYDLKTFTSENLKVISAKGTIQLAGYTTAVNAYVSSTEWSAIRFDRTADKLIATFGTGNIGGTCAGLSIEYYR